MSNQSDDQTDDLFEDLLQEFERRHHAAEENELPINLKDDRLRRVNLPSLNEIRTLFANGQSRVALSHIEDYLLQHPADVDAQLLKAEICLDLGVQSAYVGQVLAELATSHANVAAYRRLAVAVEQTIREKIELARGEISYRFSEALRNFGLVADYATTDPSATLAVVLALLKHLDLDKQAIPATSKVRAALDRFITLTLDRSQPNTMPHDEAIRYRLYLMLHEGEIEQAGALLMHLGHAGRYHDHLHKAVLNRAIEVSLTVMSSLLRTGQIEPLQQVIEIGLADAPTNPTMTYFAGEVALTENRLTDALALFEAAERTSETGTRISNPLTHQRIWQIVANAAVHCAECGKAVAHQAMQCSYCGASVVKFATLLDRYQLASLLDHTNIRQISAIAQAHTLVQLGQPTAAVEKLGHILSTLPDTATVRQTLIQFQADVVGSHPELFGAQSAVAKAPDRSHAGGEHEYIKSFLAKRTWEVEDLLVLRACFLPATLTPLQLRAAGFHPTLTPHEIAQRLNQKTCHAIIKRLMAHQQLEFARDLMPVLFGENRTSKSVMDLGARLEKAIANTVEGWLENADPLLEQGKAEQVLTLCDEALALYPDHPIALLMRGRARLALGSDLAALDDFYRILRIKHFHKEPIANHTGRGCPFIHQARVLTAETLERRGNLTEALALLEVVPEVDALRQRLRRRQADVPAVRLLPADSVVIADTLTRVPASAFTHAVFGIAVRAVGRVALSPHAWAERVLKAGFDFVQILGGLRNSIGEPAFALRLISTPHPNVPEQGQLQLALLARISADDEAAAEPMACQLWMTLKDILPLRRDYAFVFEPVVDDNELDALLAPFEIETAAEIVRREDVPSADNERYAVYPFTPSLSLDLHNLCHALLRQSTPTMVSLHLAPTSLMAWERVVLDQQMAAATPIEPPYSLENVLYEDQVAKWWQEMPRWTQAHTNRYLVDALSLHAYLLQVNVAGSHHMNPLLPEQVAAALFGPAHSAGEAQYGGFEIVRASRQDELEVARRNLHTLDVERWVYTNAPEDAPRLRHLVTESEAAIAFRLPIPGPDGLPGVPMIDAKPLPPPAGMPALGTLIGESVARLASAPARILQSTDDRRRHLYIVGKTGTGKSTLIKGMALQDIEAGHGVCVVDPHGDLIEDILRRIPPERADHVIVFDPADEARPIGLNLLTHQHESERHQVVNEFIGLLMRMYDPGGTNMIVGPRFQHNVRMAMLTAMAVPGSTLLEVVRALTDTAFVKSLLPQVTDPMVRLYWEKQIAQTSDFHKSEVLDYIVSKFSRFTGDKRVRNIIGQSASTVDLRRVMDQRQVLLVNLSKGKIGPENAQFLGLLMVQQLLLTALSRSDLPANERPDFYLYVDEFQNFATEMFGTMLSEGRKYGVALTIANQYLTQLPHPIREAIFGNVGSIVSFRLGTQDANALAPELYPVFGVDDLLNLPRYTACVKLLVDGLATRPFTMRTVPDLHAPNPALADAIRERSRTIYGRDEREVSEEVLLRLKARG